MTQQDNNFEILNRHINDLKAKILDVLELINGIGHNAKREELAQLYTRLLTEKLNVQRFVLLLNADTWIINAQHNAFCHAEDCHKWVSAVQELNGLKPIDTTTQPDPTQNFNYVLSVWHTNLDRSNEQHIAVLYFYMGTHLQPAAQTDLDLVKAVTSTLAIGLENKRLFNEARKGKAIQEEADLASEQINKILPKQLPNTAHSRFETIFKPFKNNVGGDFFDCAEVNNRVIFVIADVSGKGWGAAIVAMIAIGVLRASYHLTDKLEHIVRNLNQILFLSTEGDSYLTMFLGKWNPKNSTLEYVTAGHPHPYLYMNNKIFRLSRGCTIIGNESDLGKIQVGRKVITSRAFLLTFTDGLEPKTSMNFNKTCTQFKAIIAAANDLSIEHLKHEWLQVISPYEEKSLLNDDLTVLIGEFLPPAHA